MASIRKRGSSYLIVVSMGYDYNGKRIKPQRPWPREDDGGGLHVLVSSGGGGRARKGLASCGAIGVTLTLHF